MRIYLSWLLGILCTCAIGVSWAYDDLNPPKPKHRTATPVSVEKISPPLHFKLNAKTLDDLFPCEQFESADFDLILEEKRMIEDELHVVVSLKGFIDWIKGYQVCTTHFEGVLATVDGNRVLLTWNDVDVELSLWAWDDGGATIRGKIKYDDAVEPFKGEPFVPFGD